MHLSTTPARCLFSRAARTRSLSRSCLLMAFSLTCVPGSIDTATLNRVGGSDRWSFTLRQRPMSVAMEQCGMVGVKRTEIVSWLPWLLLLVAATSSEGSDRSTCSRLTTPSCSRELGCSGSWIVRMISKISSAEILLSSSLLLLLLLLLPLLLWSSFGVVSFSSSSSANRNTDRVESLHHDEGDSIDSELPGPLALVFERVGMGRPALRRRPTPFPSLVDLEASVMARRMALSSAVAGTTTPLFWCCSKVPSFVQSSGARCAWAYRFLFSTENKVGFAFSFVGAIVFVCLFCLFCLFPVDSFVLLACAIRVNWWLSSLATTAI
mmetsp:Transcript_11963/g.25267  ORF Transcript_11963/g.25267 Transcript_11963/m.25267 type:complete len:323 (+) Transcript_11963:2427-3395(+)